MAAPSRQEVETMITNALKEFEDKVGQHMLTQQQATVTVEQGRVGLAEVASQAKAEMDKLLSNLTAFYDYLDYGMARLKTFEAVKVNQSALFANGYCLGGQMVLELARRGYESLIGVSSFHGELGNLTSQANDRFGSDVAVAVHHADLDYQGFQALLNIEDEFRRNNVTRWVTTKYGNCHHAWTVPSNANYKPFAAAQSHDYMNSFYCAVLKGSESLPKGCA